MNIKQRVLLIIIGLILTIPSYAITYEYDELNRLKLAIYNNGRMLSYNYDAAGNLIDFIPMIECGNLEDNSSDDDTSGTDNTGGTNSEGDNSNDNTDSTDNTDNTNSEKVTICHIPSGNPSNAKTSVISSNAVEAHLSHGDTLGVCPNDNSDSSDNKDNKGKASSKGKKGQSTRKRSTRSTRQVGCPIEPVMDLVAEKESNSETIDSTINIIDDKPVYPVYRFWSFQNKKHFFTIDENEKDNMIANYPSESWRFSGEAYYVYKGNLVPKEASPVYRFWSSINKAHFFTINEAEKDMIIANYPEENWKYGGIAWYAYKASDAPEGTIPVYRFYSALNKTHFFTANETEKNHIIATYPEENWKYGGIAWYAYE